MQILITVDGNSFTATLGEGTAARDLVTKLPVSVELSDFHDVEKVAHLPEGLHVYGEPEAMKPAAGDVAYDSRWGNFAMFYRDGDETIGLIKLGVLDGDPSVLEAIPEDAPVVISVAA